MSERILAQERMDLRYWWRSKLKRCLSCNVKMTDSPGDTLDCGGDCQACVENAEVFDSVEEFLDSLAEKHSWWAVPNIRVWLPSGITEDEHDAFMDALDPKDFEAAFSSLDDKNPYCDIHVSRRRYRRTMSKINRLCDERNDSGFGSTS